MLITGHIVRDIKWYDIKIKAFNILQYRENGLKGKDICQILYKRGSIITINK